MTRTQYIEVLDELHEAAKKVQKIRNTALKALGEAVLSPLEEDRAQKTNKAIDDLATRLYEDGAVCRRVREENLAQGITEQDELDFRGGHK